MKMVVKFKDGTTLTQFIDVSSFKGNFFKFIQNNIKNNTTIETTDHATEEVVEMNWAEVYSLEIIIGE
ncbi:hypothetical protein J7E79_03760 [Bacillus sp. ISL-40]|uniref:hypothetical protein n=1 Tax=Bacillus sp. ISL-40 TaxID=2819126 RepID=UPI001BEB075D|nr:hypothetical protein [Bacillus sp. ISL-40]MBT2696542.1 hypothetical protein [Bacillus sp. ISL-40]